MADVKVSIAKAAEFSNALKDFQGTDRGFSGHGILVPPYDPSSLLRQAEFSDALRPNLDGYVTNIESFGHRFEPVIDLEADDASDKVRVALYLGKERENPNADPADLLPSEEEVKQKMEELKFALLLERSRVNTWFENAVADTSFTELRRRTRLDLEITGNAYWEVLRDKDNKPRELVYLPSYSMRLRARDKERTECQKLRRTPDLDIEKVEAKKYFRKFVQGYYTSSYHESYSVSSSQKIVYFKEYGDPRIISSATGKDYRTLRILQREEPGVPEATEVIHFRVFFPGTSYGIPRWIGALLAVLGNRKVDEVNLAYFSNKAVPPLAVLVSGGQLNDDTRLRIQNYIEENIKGSENFHSILILEAEGAGTEDVDIGKMKIELVPLTSAQLQDGQFQQYKGENKEDVGGAFRLPKMLRGDIKDFNRATADAALDFAEAQVFAPERNEFDYRIDHTILLELGCKLLRFKSNGPIRANPEKLAKMIKDLENVLPAGLALDLAEQVFNRNFEDVKAEWAHFPWRLTQSSLTKGSMVLNSPLPEQDTENVDNPRE